jgi:hypothetical protein
MKEEEGKIELARQRRWGKGRPTYPSLSAETRKDAEDRAVRGASKQSRYFFEIEVGANSKLISGVYMHPVCTKHILKVKKLGFFLHVEEHVLYLHVKVHIKSIFL